MNSFKELYHHILSFFTYSYTEKKGIIFLLSLYLIYLTITELIFTVEPTDRVYDHSEFKEEVEAFLLSREDDKNDFARFTKPSKERVEIKLFYFNPNLISKDSLLILGFTEYTAGNVVKYRKSGGRFETKEDLQKIYGINENFYNKIKEYIDIIPAVVNQTNRRDSLYKVDDRDKKQVFDINTADENELMKISGVGPAFASRIVKYRRILGGFRAKKQLLEVYGIDQIKYDEISESCTIIDTTIRMLNVNKLQAKELMAHPYFTDWNLVNAIIQYREQHGPFGDVSELKRIHLFDTVLYNTIYPYLTVSDEE